MVVRTIESPVGAEVVIDGRRYINFGGSSYLGLSTRPDIVEEGISALRESGSGYQFPRHHHVLTRGHQAIEAEAAEFFGCEAALYLASGYFFGLVATHALRESISVIFYDEWAHFSLREGIAASGVRSHAFRHLDTEDLRTKLRAHVRAHDMPLVVTDGMYSTFGEIAQLGELAAVLEPYDGRLLVDESHSFGVLGPLGRGASEHHKLPDHRVLIGGSLCKGLGSYGGVIPAREFEVDICRSTPAARGAAAGSPAAAAMAAAALRTVRDNPELLSTLRENVVYLKREFRSIGIPIADTPAPVAAFVPDRGQTASALQRRLLSEGIHVFHSTYIGAPSGGVIRCGIFADHKRQHIDCLVDALRRLL
jgi:8-amino-7-oxononanoate synthase